MKKVICILSLLILSSCYRLFYKPPRLADFIYYQKDKKEDYFDKVDTASIYYYADSSFDKNNYSMLKFYSNYKLCYLNVYSKNKQQLKSIINANYLYIDTTIEHIGIFKLESDTILFSALVINKEWNQKIFFKHKGYIKNIDTIMLYIPKDRTLNLNFSTNTHEPILFIRERL